MIGGGAFCKKVDLANQLLENSFRVEVKIRRRKRAADVAEEEKGHRI